MTLTHCFIVSHSNYVNSFFMYPLTMPHLFFVIFKVLFCVLGLYHQSNSFWNCCVLSCFVSWWFIFMDWCIDELLGLWLAICYCFDCHWWWFVWQHVINVTHIAIKSVIILTHLHSLILPKLSLYHQYFW